MTFEEISSAAAVMLALFAAVITIDKVVDIFKKWRAPSTDMAKMLANDKARLDNHDKAIQKLQESNRVLMSGIMALLDHELHNGNSDQMTKARDEIMDYLQGNVAKP